MRRHKYLLVCPIVMVTLTIGLWIEGRGEYRREYARMVWDHGGDGPAEWEIFYTDHTAFPIQVAGMLSIPVATFAAPLYALAQGGVSRARLLGWLLAVAVLWAYIGWRFDNQGRWPPIKSPYRQIIGIVFSLLSIVLLLNTVTMFHVGLVYRAIGIVWVIAMLRHSLQFFKNPTKQSAEP